ncbi:hypothetical protein BDZ89DRAFT_1068019 [Hymenopellis radicata]|nr:hypothetical protein BDZ89DRAFT_1068019 [Hymenopellis radicata]
MTRELSDVDAVLHLIFSGGPSQETTEELDELETQIDEIDSSQRDERLQDPNQRPSIYVKVFEDMFNEVEGFEKYLFSDGEWFLMGHISNLDYKSRDDENEPVAGPSRTATPTPQTPPPEFAFFCADEATMSLDLILDTLDLQDLKNLAKDLKIPTGTAKKRDIKAALLKHAQNQTILPLEPSPKKGKKKKPMADKLTQTTLSFQVKAFRRPTAESQEQRLRELAMKRLGKCVSINPNFFLLVRRMCIIYYRSTHMPRDILRPSLLSEFKKRTYPKYNYKRSTVYETRENLLEFEDALELEDELQAILDADEDTLLSSTQDDKVKTPAVGAGTPGLPPSQRQEAEDDMEVDDIPEPQTALEIRNTILPRWRKCVKAKREEMAANGQADVDLRPGLDRFEPGFVYTRMVSKGAEALAHLKEYAAEVKLLNELLAQRFWRRGKRGSWYDRRALSTITYLSKTEGKKRKNNKVLREASVGLREALEDDDTHIADVVRSLSSGLLRRLQKLEKTLKVPEDERATCEGELKEPVVIEVRASRVKSDPLKLNQLGQLMKGKENRPVASLAGNGGRKWGAKSVWYGDRNEEVNVETRALQDYEKLGYKGMHAETSIVTTIFGLLFWDIIFADVAPLDIAEDSFYYARKELIDKRLRELRAGLALEILERHDRTYRPTNTWCVGVRWDLCTKEDLREIVECFSGSSLATICQLFCEDYSGRSSGVPDLIVWNYEERECKFVEVKGPGDKPSENQKLWFDALHRANITVELCHVVDLNAKVKRLNTKLKRKAKQMEVETLSGREDGDETLDELDGAPPATPARRKIERDLDEVVWPSTPSSSRRVKVEVVIPTPPSAKRIKVEVDLSFV